MKRFLTKKAVAITAAAGLALGMAGVAVAYYSVGGSATGSATSGFTTSYTVGSPTFTGPPLQPGGIGDTIQATVQNNTGAPLSLNKLEVTISGVTMNAPGSAFAAAGSPPCTVADYQLAAPLVSNWSFPGGTTTPITKIGPDAVLSLPGAFVQTGHFVINGVPDGTVAGNALPEPLLLEMVNSLSNQNACQGASVQVTVSAS